SVYPANECGCQWAAAGGGSRQLVFDAGGGWCGEYEVCGCEARSVGSARCEAEWTAGAGDGAGIAVAGFDAAGGGRGDAAGGGRGDSAGGFEGELWRAGARAAGAGGDGAYAGGAASVQRYAADGDAGELRGY